MRPRSHPSAVHQSSEPNHTASKYDDSRRRSNTSTTKDYAHNNTRTTRPNENYTVEDYHTINYFPGSSYFQSTCHYHSTNYSTDYPTYHSPTYYSGDYTSDYSAYHHGSDY
ncbi:hypothetical protein FOZ60_004854 [Perkinsus olseni]|uniref:Uncharacterized protein n=1 Tax=Perkinsus olseni TaxID=32597 RepID=A0A7J6PGN0_PEROL|nr:hypothetical protein FOZ60_004854 [Perkinsus olseni]